MENKGFLKNKEDFTCKHCGFHVKGDGYTNHCPNCLWSLHVDYDPGDRKNPCKSLMEPVSLRIFGHQINLIHKCHGCRSERIVRVSKNDNQDEITELASK